MRRYHLVILLSFILTSCANLPSSSVMPSESQGGCPGSLTTVRTIAQPGARITTHLTETGEQLGANEVSVLGTEDIGPITSGYDYTFAITGRRGGYEVQHHYVPCAVPFYDMVFGQYVWDPPWEEDVVDMIVDLDWCKGFRGTPLLCSALVYDGESDWIDGNLIEKHFGTAMGYYTDANSGYFALFLERVEMHDSRTSDMTFWGPDQPYGNVNAYFIPNNKENNEILDAAYDRIQSSLIENKNAAFLEEAKKLAIHADHLDPLSEDAQNRPPDAKWEPLSKDEWEKWDGLTIPGPAFSEKKDCVFLDQTCIPFVEVGVDYKNFPLLNWAKAYEHGGADSVIAIFYEHDSGDDHDIIDQFIIDRMHPNLERVRIGSHVFRFTNRMVGQVDSDVDGRLDDEDNCPFANNASQNDIDGDGIGDVCDDDMDGDGVVNEDDNCPAVSNPDQGDNEPTPPGTDGVGDACDNDDDDDGIFDIDDNCDFTQNPGQEDLDGDGDGDACDGDVDGDGVADTVDNCPQTPNALQEDNEGDGLGDICDDDDDDDGIDDLPDNCPLDANPDQEDYDQDGIGDVCDDDADGDGVLNADDCDPNNERIYPGAGEVCDGLDNDCDGIPEAGCGAAFSLQTSELEADCHAQFVCCYPCSCDPRDTDDDVNNSVAEGTVQVQCEAEASGPGGGPGCSGDGYARATIVRTYSSSGTSSASLTLDTDENESGGGCGGYNEADANVTVDVAIYRTGTWDSGEGPTVTIEATDTTRPMTILRGGIPTGEVLSAGSGSINVVLDSPLEYTAHVDGDAEGQWTFTVSD